MKRGVKSPVTDTGTSKKEALARQILNYLEKYPEAGDTLEGIATWWLEQQRIEHLVEEVAEALELLVKKGTVKAHKKTDGITTYKIKNNNPTNFVI